MEVDKLKGDGNPEGPMSGAYIRSLVKNLRSKEAGMSPNPNCSSPSGNPSKMAEEIPKPQQQKKQVRRRLHTSRPYQERLLNMAEARREIVTALKYHRAAMKKAAEQQGEPQTAPETPPARCHQEEEVRTRGRKIPQWSSTERNGIVYPESNLSDENSNNKLKKLCYPSMNYSSFPTWSANPQSNLDIVLPEQTLGLNLNLQDFNNLEANMYANGGVSGSSSSSSRTDQEGRNSVSVGSEGTESNGVVGSGGGGGGGGGMHVTVGEEEMAEMRSIGEKHEMEWSDKMNMVKSAWWLRFMKMGKKEDEDQEEEGLGFGFGDPFDQILEFPDWMNNGNDRCFEQQLLNDYCSSDYDFFHDNPSALPRMDIGEFEGMDGEWLA